MMLGWAVLVHGYSVVVLSLQQAAKIVQHCIEQMIDGAVSNIF